MKDTSTKTMAQAESAQASTQTASKEAHKEPQQKAPKRTVYKAGGLLDMPESELDRARYGYRWINAEKLAEASDGYEPRGWELFKDKHGKTVKRGDLILAQMPKDLHEAMIVQKEQDRKGQMQLLLESLAAEEEQMSDAFRRKGGKVKFSFTQEDQ